MKSTYNFQTTEVKISQNIKNKQIAEILVVNWNTFSGFLSELPFNNSLYGNNTS